MVQTLHLVVYGGFNVAAVIESNSSRKSHSEYYVYGMYFDITFICKQNRCDLKTSNEYVSHTIYVLETYGSIARIFVTIPETEGKVNIFFFLPSLVCKTFLYGVFFGWRFPNGKCRSTIHYFLFHFIAISKIAHEKTREK